jgi:hypothetical protein
MCRPNLLLIIAVCADAILLVRCCIDWASCSYLFDKRRAERWTDRLLLLPCQDTEIVDWNKTNEGKMSELRRSAEESKRSTEELRRSAEEVKRSLNNWNIALMRRSVTSAPSAPKTRRLCALLLVTSFAKPVPTASRVSRSAPYCGVFHSTEFHSTSSHVWLIFSKGYESRSNSALMLPVRSSFTPPRRTYDWFSREGYESRSNSALMLPVRSSYRQSFCIHHFTKLFDDK